MSLDAIPIHVIPATAPDGGLTGNATPLLREIAEMLRQLVESNTVSAIDLTALPLTPADLEWLRNTLGQGEISVRLQANGLSTLDETACPGVWWVTHHNEQGAITTQLIEVAFVPELVKADPRDVSAGLDQLDLTLGDL